MRTTLPDFPPPTDGIYSAPAKTAEDHLDSMCDHHWEYCKKHCGTPMCNSVGPQITGASK